MRKLTLLYILVATLAFVGCSKEQSQVETLEGTNWAASYADGALWIQFTSASEFQEFYGDDYGNPNSTGVHFGSYKLEETHVSFITHESTSPFDYAELRGNKTVLELTYKSGYTRTFIKKQNTCTRLLNHVHGCGES